MIRRLITTFVGQDLPSASECLTLKNKQPAVSFPTPALDSLGWLFTVAPGFALRGDQITVIYEPQEFYQTIIERCSSARNRIVLASLYLGSGYLEHALVKTIRNNLKQNPQLTVQILLDFARGTRGEKNSKTMLLPLVQEFSNCSLSLYHTPVLRGITKKLAPQRWNELLGLQHMKVYLFDDSVIISGANLSNDYFTNRQDRYILIEDKALANFYSAFISKVQEFSLSVNKHAEIGLHSSWKLLPYEGEKYDFIENAKGRIMGFFQDIYRQQELFMKNKVADTWIFPFIEMGQLGIHHDSVATKKLLSSAISESKLKLATGYFNLTQDYMDTITTNCLAQCSILMAHPNANGFQGASGPAGGIPAAYSLIARHFYENLQKAKQDYRVNLFEYEKEGWSYHAKGLWYYLPNSELPDLTLIGSSNFGERSVNRDLETQICIVTTNINLRNNLQTEVDNLYKLGSTAEREITSRPVPKWVQAVVKVFRNFF